MAVTLDNLREILYDLLREEQDSTAYPFTLVDLMLNSSELRICTGQVVNPLNGDVVRKGRLPFLNTDKFYSNVGTTSLSADTSVGATTLTVNDASNFPSSGTLYINGNMVTYTGTTSTTFTGVSGVLFAFESGTEVSAAFDLPSDYSSPLGLTYNNRFKLDQKQYDDIFEDLNRIKGSVYQRNRSQPIYESTFRIPPFYTIINGSYIVIFNLNETGDLIHFRYEKVPTEMTATTDNATIDNDIYAKTTIPYLAAGEMLYNRGEEQRGAELINFALGQIQEMYDFYNNATFERLTGKQYKTAKGTLNI